MESQTAFETAAALLVQFRGQARMLELCEVDFDCGTHKRRYACGELPEELEL